MGPGSLVKEMLRTAGPFSPECVEGSFCELRLYGVLRSSYSLSPIPMSLSDAFPHT
jgi:hypothetical protein